MKGTTIDSEFGYKKRQIFSAHLKKYANVYAFFTEDPDEINKLEMIKDEYYSQKNEEHKKEKEKYPNFNMTRNSTFMSTKDLFLYNSELLQDSKIRLVKIGKVFHGLLNLFSFKNAIIHEFYEEFHHREPNKVNEYEKKEIIGINGFNLFNDKVIAIFNDYLYQYKKKFRKYIKISMKKIQKLNGNYCFIYVDYHYPYWWRFNNSTCVKCTYLKNYKYKDLNLELKSQRGETKVTRVISIRKVSRRCIKQRKWKLLFYKKLYKRTFFFRKFKPNEFKFPNESLCPENSFREKKCKTCQNIIEEGKIKCLACGTRNFDYFFYLTIFAAFSFAISIVSLIISIFS